MIHPNHTSMVAVGAGLAFGLALTLWGMVDYLTRRSDFLSVNLARLSD